MDINDIHMVKNEVRRCPQFVKLFIDIILSFGVTPEPRKI